MAPTPGNTHTFRCHCGPDQTCGCVTIRVGDEPKPTKAKRAVSVRESLGLTVRSPFLKRRPWPLRRAA